MKINLLSVCVFLSLALFSLLGPSRKTSVTDLLKQVFKTIVDSRKVMLKDLKLGPHFGQIFFGFSQYVYLICSIIGL